MPQIFKVIADAIAAFIDETVKGIQLVTNFFVQTVRAFGSITLIMASVPSIFVVAGLGILSALFFIHIINKGG